MFWRAARWARSRSAASASLVFAALVFVPVAASAQQAGSNEERQRTHTVRKKDTLWDLAAAYLGDAFQWPEIYRINTDVVEDPHWIYPGEVLKIPGKLPAVAEAPKAELPPVPEPVNTPEKEIRELPPVDAEDTPLFVRQSGHARNASTRIHESVTAVAPPTTTVRFGQFLAAPFVDRKGGPRGSGRVIESADLTTITMGQQERFKLDDQVLVSPPVGNVAPEGERFISYVNGPYLDKLGQVIIPTGVVQVTRAPRRGEWAVARVVRIFRDVGPGQRLMPYDSAALAVRGRARDVSDGRWARVQWIENEPLMPTLQSYVVLNISEREGVQLGDEFELFQPRRPREDGGELARPEVSVAHAQVVRVTPYATTVLITRQEQPKIDNGTMARISAKMP